MDTSARECDVCFDPVPLWDDHVASICKSSCPAVLCIDCARSYLQNFATSIVPGLVMKMRCPVCPSHMPLSRVSHVDADISTWITTLTYKATELRCSYCDQSTPLLGPEYPTPAPLLLTPSLKKKLPWLRRLVRKFVRYRISATTLYDYITRTFGPWSLDAGREDGHVVASVERDFLVAEHVMNLLDDPERRTTFGLLHFSRVGVVNSPCCSVELCYNCKSAFHFGHCERLAQQAFNDVVTCPECSISLVRGDGCDSMTCVCSAEFSWSDRVEVAGQLRRNACMDALLRRPRGADSMRAVLAFCRQQAWKRRFQAHVLRELRTKAHAKVWRQVVEYCKRLAWKTKFSAVLHRLIRACLLREISQERERRQRIQLHAAPLKTSPTALLDKESIDVTETPIKCAAMA